MTAEAFSGLAYAYVYPRPENPASARLRALLYEKTSYDSAFAVTTLKENHEQHH